MEFGSTKPKGQISWAWQESGLSFKTQQRSAPSIQRKRRILAAYARGAMNAASAQLTVLLRGWKIGHTCKSQRT
jgi:hypothetical protein